MNQYSNNLQQPAQACIIWMHGLGADSADMAGLARQLPLNEIAIQHIFLDAPVRPVTLNNGMRMRAWYDILGLTLNAREDKQGITESQMLIRQAINQQLDSGFLAEQIILAGFSQGGAMALYTSLHLNMPLAGVIALSAYLPLATDCNPILPKNTPFFIGGGRFDTVVLPQWTKQSADALITLGYSAMTYRDYPMDHSICSEEVNDFSHWIMACVTGAVK